MGRGKVWGSQISADVEMPHYPKCELYFDRPCSVCGLKLGQADLKVHPGRCARARKTELQRMRRARRRPHVG